VEEHGWYTCILGFFSKIPQVQWQGSLALNGDSPKWDVAFFQKNLVQAINEIIFISKNDPKSLKSQTFCCFFVF
jgi:hypothetical protein